MKIEDLAYGIAGETLAMLEKKYYYRIPEDHKREIQNAVRDQLDAIMEKAKSGTGKDQAPR